MTAPDYSQQPAYDPNFRNIISSYGAGTAYTITNAQAQIVFGTTSPSIVLPAGRFLIHSRCHWTYAAATFAATKNITFNLYRANNTPGNVTGAQSVSIAAIVTTITQDGQYVILPPILYTATGGDNLVLYCGVATAPSAGNITVTEAEIIAVPIAS